MTESHFYMFGNISVTGHCMFIPKVSKTSVDIIYGHQLPLYDCFT